jgi:signal transduction histidine kinase
MTANNGHRHERKRSNSASWVASVLAIGLLAAGTAGVLLSRAPGDEGSTVGFMLGISGAAGALVFLPATQKAASYYATQVVVCLFLLVAVGAAGPFPLLTALVLSAGIVELVLLEAYPGNLFMSLGLTVGGVLARLVPDLSDAVTVELLLGEHAPFLAVAGALACVGSLMTKHRELNVTLGERIRQLEESVIELAKANASFQDVAVDARERATENERQRITRDIHDIIGYTLTNNMMLMEAAQDLMQENALALPGIIEQARSNAEEGLQRIRKAMYRLRQEEVTYPSGLNAVMRLIRIFERSTAVKIRYDFSNAPNSISEPVDSAVYHLVQESLVNAFRHGKATEVRIQCWYTGTELRVHLADNGFGATAVQEGIGISGMRERVENLQGELGVRPLPDGFEVTATIPVSPPAPAQAPADKAVSEPTSAPEDYAS